MTRKLNLVGTLELSDQEFEILLDIFTEMPISIMLCSSYISIKYKENINLLTDDQLSEMRKLEQTYDPNDVRFSLIEKILSFRESAKITI